MHFSRRKINNKVEYPGKLLENKNVDMKLRERYGATKFHLQSGREEAMLIAQSLGREGARLVDITLAKRRIKQIEDANATVRDAIDAKVNEPPTPTTKKEKEKRREKVLTKIFNENPLFEQAVNNALFELLRQS